MFCYIYIDTTALPAAQIWLYSTSSRNQNIIFHVKTGEMAAMFNIMAAILKKYGKFFKTWNAEWLALTYRFRKYILCKVLMMNYIIYLDKTLSVLAFLERFWCLLFLYIIYSDTCNKIGIFYVFKLPYLGQILEYFDQINCIKFLLNPFIHIF